MLSVSMYLFLNEYYEYYKYNFFDMYIYRNNNNYFIILLFLHYSFIND